VRVGRIHWLCAARAGQFTAQVKLRYRQRAQSAEVYSDGDGAELRFEEGQRAATPGQYAVLYEGDRCLGGAVIQAA